MPEPERTESRVALVTGASRGIGRAIAVELARAGFDIGVHYCSSREGADETARAVNSAGREAVILQADLASSNDRSNLLDQVRARFGRLDALINNAAMSHRLRYDLLEVPESEYDAILAANLKGPFFLTQAAAAWMVEQRAAHPKRPLAIVNLSSVSEYASSPNRGPYCLAKAGVGMLTRLFADRLGEQGILVNEIRPGVIATDMTAGVKDKYDRLIADGLTPLRRWGQPEDVARVVRSLLSSDFGFSTGAAIDVDGGFHVRRL